MYIISRTDRQTDRNRSLNLGQVVINKSPKSKKLEKKKPKH